jgi:hypothetical protein
MKIILYTILVMTFLYVLFVFTTFDINIADWQELTRYALAFLWFWCVAIALAIKINKEI